MARMKMVNGETVPMTAAEEAQRDSDEAKWAARKPKTNASIVENQLRGDHLLVALVGELASRFGISEAELRDAIKARVPAP